MKPKPGEAAAIRRLYNMALEKSDECQFLATNLEAFRFIDRPVSAQWISCRLVNGVEPSRKAVPVSSCGVAGCVNGKHMEWKK